MIDGPKLRELRKAKGLTLQALADKSGLVKSYVWDIENGNAPSPSLNTGFGLADALGVPLYHLVGREENK